MVNTPKKERSRAYPVMALADALTRISNINENLGLQGRYNRETIATGMGYSGLSGTSARAVAALAQYGLLDREKDQYSLSRLAKKYLTPVEDHDQLTAVRTAALSPSLFAEIYQAFKGQVIPKQFVNRLIHEFGIQQKAAPEVERTFKATMITADILQKKNNMLVDEVAEQANEDNLPPPEISGERSSKVGALEKSQPNRSFVTPDNYLTVKLPSGLLVGYDQSLASAFAFGVFGERLKELDEAVATYKKEHSESTEEHQNEPR